MRKALLIGIDNYATAPLSGCVGDVARLEKLLARHASGDRNFDCRVLVAPRGGAGLGKAEVRQAIEQLFANEAHEAFLHFSGHGLVNELGGFIVTSDGRSYDEGIPMQQLMRLAGQSRIREIAISLDCCHSGALGVGDVVGSEGVLLREGLALLAASGIAQPSVETAEGGLFTQLMCDALEGQAADLFGHVTLAGIYAHVESHLSAWAQRPRFRANLCSFTPLREVAPAIPTATLRKLPELFASATATHALSPAYEPTCEPRDAALEQTFADLQSLCGCGLVEPVGERHMYYAAIHGTACRLTLQGQRYYRLAKNGRI
jgi:hypothetical protein